MSATNKRIDKVGIVVSFGKDGFKVKASDEKETIWPEKDCVFKDIIRNATKADMVHVDELSSLRAAIRKCLSDSHLSSVDKVGVLIYSVMYIHSNHALFGIKAKLDMNPPRKQSDAI
jgi:hypothetical protein